MTALFQLPKAISTPGAKLTFTLTGTTTPQNTYQEEALSTPHSNPVVADANGVFAPIYLDPRLPSYRVKLTTSADVLVYQVDGIPSNQNTATSNRIESTNPITVWYDTDGTSNQRKFYARAIGDDFEIGSLNDAENLYTPFMTIAGGVSPYLDISSGSKVNDGVTSYPVAYTVSSSYTGTLTGFSGADPTGTIRYCKIGDMVSLFYPDAGSGFSGTSDATSMTITGMPAAIRPARTQYVAIPPVGDNSLLIGDGESIVAKIETSGVITFMINGSDTGFTASGIKGTGTGGTITYLTS